ncbi:MAG: dihydrofolate reductase [Bacteroidales bacterium]|nr:dihydrofolate reductase [Bacteroidales bacterium]
MGVTSLSAIAAVGNNFELGYKNQLLCHLPADLKWFKKITSGHPVIMGDKTWESLTIKPLPNRQNIVMTLDKAAQFQNCDTAYSIEEAIALVADDEEAFIIGGATIYNLFINKINKLYLTKIQSNFEADVYFPKVDFSRWVLKEDLFLPKDEKNIYDLHFQTYELIEY